ISLLSLLINSESHQELLLKVLNDAHVLQDITPKKFEGIINNITASRHLSFLEDEVSTEGRTHNQSLHITVKCGGYMMAKVLINNGSSLNVMPKAMLDKVYLPGATLKNSPLVVRAFDGSKREVMGKITLPIRIGPKTFDVTFQVMDIQPEYSFLLGRPWIHATGAVPSSLHQKVKFVADGQLISVMGEKELIINTPLPVEYIEGDEEALETSFQVLEIIGTTSIEAEGRDPKPSRAVVMVAKVLIRNGFQPSKDLGKELHGITELVTIQENLGQSGLGYTGAMKKERPRQRDQGKQLIQLDLYRYFTSGGTISSEQIAVVEDQPLDGRSYIRPGLPENIDNATLMPDNAGKSSRSDEGDDLEEEDLEELEKLLEQEKLRLQSGAKEIEVVNVGEVKEIWSSWSAGTASYWSSWSVGTPGCLLLSASPNPPKMVSHLVVVLSAAAVVGMVAPGVLDLAVDSCLSSGACSGCSIEVHIPHAFTAAKGWCWPIASCLTNDVSSVNWFSNLGLSIVPTSFTILGAMVPLVPNCCVLLVMFEIRCRAIAGVLSISAHPLVIDESDMVLAKRRLGRNRVGLTRFWMDATESD
ncbi:hypothetical protein CR513_11374, partial [Mucuna pruriens]